MASAGGTSVIISCFSGYNIQGASVLQCVNGSWNFPVPTCFRESHNDIHTYVHNKLDVNDIGRKKIYMKLYTFSLTEIEKRKKEKKRKKKIEKSNSERGRGEIKRIEIYKKEII